MGTIPAMLRHRSFILVVVAVLCHFVACDPVPERAVLGEISRRTKRDMHVHLDDEVPPILQSHMASTVLPRMVSIGAGHWIDCFCSVAGTGSKAVTDDSKHVSSFSMPGASLAGITDSPGADAMKAVLEEAGTRDFGSDSLVGTRAAGGLVGNGFDATTPPFGAAGDSMASPAAPGLNPGALPAPDTSGSSMGTEESMLTHPLRRRLLQFGNFGTGNGMRSSQSTGDPLAPTPVDDIQVPDDPMYPSKPSSGVSDDSLLGGDKLRAGGGAANVPMDIRLQLGGGALNTNTPTVAGNRDSSSDGALPDGSSPASSNFARASDSPAVENGPTGSSNGNGKNSVTDALASISVSVKDLPTAALECFCNSNDTAQPVNAAEAIRSGRHPSLIVPMSDIFTSQVLAGPSGNRGADRSVNQTNTTQTIVKARRQPLKQLKHVFSGPLSHSMQSLVSQLKFARSSAKSIVNQTVLLRSALESQQRKAATEMRIRAEQDGAREKARKAQYEAAKRRCKFNCSGHGWCHHPPQSSSAAYCICLDDWTGAACDRRKTEEEQRAALKGRVDPGSNKFTPDMLPNLALTSWGSQHLAANEELQSSGAVQSVLN